MNTPTQNNQIEVRHFVILGILSIIWGSSFILMKKALVAFQPFDLACMRIAISALSFLPILIYHRRKIQWKKWPIHLLVGLTGSGIPAFMYFIAQTNINSMISGLLNSLTPIWTLVLGILIFKNKISKYHISGVVLGFVGAVLLMLFSETSGANKNLWFGLFIVVGTFCYGISGNVVKSYLQDIKSLLISSLSFVLIGIPAIIALVFSDSLWVMEWNIETQKSLAALIVLSLVGTVMATVLFYKLIQETSAVFGSSVAYIMPLVAIFWGVLDGEGLGLNVIISMILILTGVYLIKKES